MSTKPPNIIDTPADYHHALEALRASEERNRAILKALPDMMFLMSADDVFLDYHAKDAGQLIVPPEVFLGRNITDIMPPPLAEQLRDAFKRARLSGGPEILEYSLGVDDQARFYEARVVGCDGEKVLSIVRDITDRKRAELDADIHRRELAHLSRVWLLGELSSALAHELNQPLTAILSNAQAARAFLNHDPVDLAEVRAGLDDIIMNDKRASAVIDRVRDLLKKGSSEWEPTNVNEVVAEVLELTHSDMLARRVAVTTQLAATAPIVHADRVQLMQVLLNLGTECVRRDGRYPLRRPPADNHDSARRRIRADRGDRSGRGPSRNSARGGLRAVRDIEEARARARAGDQPIHRHRPPRQPERREQRRRWGQLHLRTAGDSPCFSISFAVAFTRSVTNRWSCFGFFVSDTAAQSN